MPARRKSVKAKKPARAKKAKKKAVRKKAAPAAEPLRIAFAVPEDEREIFYLLVDMYKENGTGEFDKVRTWQTIRTVLEQGVAVLVRRAGKIIASAGIIEDQTWYSNTVFLRDNWFYVHPTARRSTAFRRLARACQRVAEEADLPFVLSNTSPIDLERKTKAFERLGFQTFGVIMICGKERV